MTSALSASQRAFAMIVVGSGIAGASAALMAAQRGIGPVALISKEALQESNTHYAQGGIAGALPANDRASLHARDTLVAGGGGYRVEAVRRLCGGGKQALEWLIANGVPFDRAADGWSFGLEGAHSCPRILHAGGDATGAAIAATLAAQLRASSVVLFEHCMLADLTLDNGRVTGVHCLGRDGTPFWLESDAVVMATGGAGQLYAHTTNPPVATGDGVACAYRAGAVMLDAEFYQFHPTALALGEQRFLLTEALRGEGALLLDANGERFMTKVHPAAELAPRDVVARAIAANMAAQQQQPVWLDATGLAPDMLAQRFPSISAHLANHELSLAHDKLPITPAAHYWMGGIATDTWGRSSVPGLFAVGEAACSGVHGANRLASNSLLEGVVYAQRLIDGWQQQHHRWEEWQQAAGIDAIRCAGTAPADNAPEHARQPPSLDELRRLMWQHVGVERTGEGLEAALAYFRRGQRYHQCSDTRAALETRNQFEVATLIAESAWLRQESRGAHFRRDYPARDDRFTARRGVQRGFPATLHSPDSFSPASQSVAAAASLSR
ncbi:L-aspartate oxidase [Carnimonas bestiolae]|uniref:L-aspartate oxidase n=1 Tax=Carnimonas bestiolae TaxID=3402172 RepID=UPI003EDC5937